MNALTADPELVESPDADLVLRSLAGDGTALLELLAANEDRIAVVCRRYLSPCEVDDAVQETFARAIAKLGDLRDPARFGPWIRAIARNVSRDQLGHRLRTITIPDLMADTPCSEPTPDAQVVAAEDRDDVLARLSSLSDRDADALWLRDAHGAPVPEVAKTFGMTEGSTRVMLTRARQQLRAAYAGVAAWIGLWRVELRQRVSSGAAPVSWQAAAAVGALAVAAAVVPAVQGSGPAPTLLVADHRDVAAAYVPVVTSAPAPAVAGGADEAAVPTSTTREPLAGLVHTTRPDADPAVTLAAESPDGEERTAEVFAGNLADAAEDPVGTTEGLLEHLGIDKP